MALSATEVETTEPRLFIGGRWVSGSTGETIPTFDPSTGRVIGAVAAGNATDVDLAVSAARVSFERGDWAGLPPSARQKILLRVADLIEADVDRISDLETLNNGMPLSKARGHVLFAAEFFRYFAGWCTKICGSTSQISAPGEYHAYTLREPIGVAGLITPWNTPFIMAAAKLSVALAAGCSVILKPAEETPLTALLFGDIMNMAGVPPGVVNIVTGIGEIAGAALVAHPDVDKIGFTGSTEVGKKIVEAAAGNLKKLSLELGGKSPVIVFDDADVDAAAAGAARGAFGNSGQACVAGSRIYVAQTVYDRFVKSIATFANGLKVGGGHNAPRDLGPLISDRQLRRVIDLVRSGVDDGSKIVSGGERIGTIGYFMQPTVMTAPRTGARILREEIFGPVVTVIPFVDFDEVLRQANDTEFGLAAGIWTRDLGRAHRTAKRIRAGTVWLNCALVFDLSMPFGGYKQSGWGREYGEEGLGAYLQTKSVIAALQ
jgi:phenylacetaldehyde dehydrogenase